MGGWKEALMPVRALVLGGGGVTGIAWEIGVLRGLAEAGVDATAPDLVVGTSAGSVVGALVASGASLERMYSAQLSGSSQEIGARFGARQLMRFGWAMLRSGGDEQRYRARIGRMALAARTVDEAERRAVISSRLRVRDWPERRLLITAVDAQTGEFVTFDRDSGVDLIDAVGASCAVPGVWPPVTINGRRFVDGGVRSSANADLAAGYDRVLVLAPITAGGGPIPKLADQATELRRGGQVSVVVPDQAARRAIGRNVLDPAHRAPAARAGRAQGEAVAAAVAGVWSE
jgi:NTE family protein